MSQIKASISQSLTDKLGLLYGLVGFVRPSNNVYEISKLSPKIYLKITNRNSSNTDSTSIVKILIHGALFEFRVIYLINNENEELFFWTQPILITPALDKLCSFEYNKTLAILDTQSTIDNIVKTTFSHTKKSATRHWSIKKKIVSYFKPPQEPIVQECENLYQELTTCLTPGLNILQTHASRAHLNKKIKKAPNDYSTKVKRVNKI